MKKYQNNEYESNIKCPKNHFQEKKSFYSVLKGFDEKIDSYSQRTKELLNNYSQRKKMDSVINEPKDDSKENSMNFQNKIKELEKKYQQAEQRSLEALNIISHWREKNCKVN